MSSASVARRLIQSPKMRADQRSPGNLDTPPCREGNIRGREVRPSAVRLSLSSSIYAWVPGGTRHGPRADGLDGACVYRRPLAQKPSVRSVAHVPGAPGRTESACPSLRRCRAGVVHVVAFARLSVGFGSGWNIATTAERAAASSS